MIKDRIIQIIEYKNLKKEDFYRKIGMSSANFRGKAKETPLNSQAIENILAEIPDINPEWLLTGKGQMLKKIQLSNTYKNFPKKLVQNEQITNNQLFIQETESVSISVVDVSAAAGHGFLNSDHPETQGNILLPGNMLQNPYATYYCGRVCGESMSPTLLHNDFIVFRLLENSELFKMRDGEIYFIVDREGNAYVKRIENLLATKQKIKCISDNLDKQNYKDFYIDGYDIARIFHVEWRFSNNLAFVNRNIFEQIASIESRLDTIEKKGDKKVN